MIARCSTSVGTIFVVPQAYLCLLSSSSMAQYHLMSCCSDCTTGAWCWFKASLSFHRDILLFAFFFPMARHHLMSFCSSCSAGAWCRVKVFVFPQACYVVCFFFSFFAMAQSCIMNCCTTHEGKTEE